MSLNPSDSFSELLVLTDRVGDGVGLCPLSDGLFQPQIPGTENEITFVRVAKQH